MYVCDVCGGTYMYQPHPADTNMMFSQPLMHRGGMHLQGSIFICTGSLNYLIGFSGWTMTCYCCNHFRSPTSGMQRKKWPWFMVWEPTVCISSIPLESHWRHDYLISQIRSRHPQNTTAQYSEPIRPVCCWRRLPCRCTVSVLQRQRALM
jgi:hypothetical protein